MRRRGFIGSLIAAAPAAAVSGDRPADDEAWMMSVPSCECGHVFLINDDKTTMVCINPYCAKREIKYHIPRVKLTRAEP